jgi:ADP-ribose pyrophosphatase
MPLGRWKKLITTVVQKNPWWSYCRDEYMLPAGNKGEYHYVHTNGSAMTLPLMEDGKILLINQYRYLAGRESLEFPCGSVKDDASYDQTAWHELAEETGYSAKNLYQVGEFNPYNGVTDEMCRVYVATDLKYVGPLPDETEEFELIPLTPMEIESKIADGTIWDGMSIAAWGVAKGTLARLLKEGE